MFGFAWSELVLIGAVALVVIGPKDLPKVMRTMGQWSRKVRVLASDFQRHVDDMVRQAELEEIKRQAEQTMEVNSIGREIEEAVDAPGIERSLNLDEASAAAELPAAPQEGAAAETAPEPPPAPAETSSAHSEPASPPPTEPQRSDAPSAGADETAPARETTP